MVHSRRLATLFWYTSLLSALAHAAVACGFTRDWPVELPPPHALFDGFETVTPTGPDDFPNVNVARVDL